MTRPGVTHLPLGLGEPSAASHGERETATSTRRRGAGRRKSQRPPFCIWWRETLPQSPAATLPTPVLEGESCTDRLASSEPACSTRHGPRLPKNCPRGDAGGMQSSPWAALFLGAGETKLAGSLWSLGMSPPAQAKLTKHETMAENGLCPFQLKSGHHRYGSYEHIVKALVIKTNQLSRRRRGPCTQ